VEKTGNIFWHQTLLIRHQVPHTHPLFLTSKSLNQEARQSKVAYRTCSRLVWYSKLATGTHGLIERMANKIGRQDVSYSLHYILM